MGVYHNRHEVAHVITIEIVLGTPLSDCKDDDIILIGDVDEIPTKQSILETQDRLSKDPNKIVCFQQRHFNYYFNGVCVYQMTTFHLGMDKLQLHSRDSMKLGLKI